MFQRGYYKNLSLRWSADGVSGNSWQANIHVTANLNQEQVKPVKNLQDRLYKDMFVCLLSISQRILKASSFNISGWLKPWKGIFGTFASVVEHNNWRGQLEKSNWMTNLEPITLQVGFIPDNGAKVSAGLIRHWSGCVKVPANTTVNPNPVVHQLKLLQALI